MITRCRAIVDATIKLLAKETLPVSAAQVEVAIAVAANRDCTTPAQIEFAKKIVCALLKVAA